MQTSVKKCCGKQNPCCSNSEHNNRLNKVYLNRILKKEVEIGANGTQRYVLKQGKNKGTILWENKNL